MTPACKDCRFCDRLRVTDAVSSYECRRRAPIIIRRPLPPGETSDDGYTDELESAWPEVEALGWCGEFSPVGP